MPRVQGVKEKLHLPLYDDFFVPPGTNFGTEMNKRDPRVIRFFVDVQNKTKLDTNLQASGVLPSLNTFEARAMRVVVSTPRAALNSVSMLTAANTYCNTTKDKAAQDALIAAIQLEFERSVAEIGASLILSELIYNSVTTLLVGEKVMIEMPTFYFPAGAGVSQGNGNGAGTNHGEPDPMATFRFAEPVFIEPQQNFRVEMLFPQSLPSIVSSAPGPLRIWTVLDGYLTRDVQ